MGRLQKQHNAVVEYIWYTQKVPAVLHPVIVLQMLNKMKDDITSGALQPMTCNKGSSESGALCIAPKLVHHASEFSARADDSPKAA